MTDTWVSGGPWPTPEQRRAQEARGTVIVTSEGRYVNADHVVAIAVRFLAKHPEDHGRDVWEVQLELTDGTTATRGCHDVRDSAERQLMMLLDALGWRAV